MGVMRLFEAKALAEALRESGYEVSARTVQRWKSGKQPKPQDLAAIYRLIEDERAAPPQWAERLAAGVEKRFTDRLEKWQRDQEEAQRVIADAAARLERLGRSRGGRSGKEDQETDG